MRLDSDARRAQILGAARRLWTSKPYSEVSMAELAEAAGVARGLLHHYFGSKRELYLAVVRDVVRVPELTVAGPDGDGAAASVWDASVDGWMHLMEAGRDSWRGPLAGAAGSDPELEAILDESKELVVERTLQALGVDPALAPDALRALVRAYGGLAEEVTREWLERGRLSRDEARLVLRRTLPLLLEEVLPDVLPPSG